MNPPKPRHADVSITSTPQRSRVPILTFSITAIAFSISLTANAGPFSLTRHSVEIAERGLVTQTVLMTTNSRFSFVAPAGWSASLNTNAEMVTWLWADLSSTITLKIISVSHQLSAEQQRSTTLSRFPGAKIENEFPCYTSGSQGHAIDLRTTVNGTLVRAIRVARVAFQSAAVEFELMCPPDLFGRHEREFTELLNSFRIER